MLSSIHPLGERARSNRWATTITAFTLGSLLGGLALTAVASHVGVLAGFRVEAPWVLIPLAVAALADLIGIPVTSPHRQVNERWIGTYRGWVYQVRSVDGSPATLLDDPECANRNAV